MADVSAKFNNFDAPKALNLLYQLLAEQEGVEISVVIARKGEKTAKEEKPA